MEEEKSTSSKIYKLKENKEKLTELLAIAQKRYEKFLKGSLKSARKSYLKGKLDILKRLSEAIDKIGQKSPSSYKEYLLSKKFDDVPNKKKIFEESESENPVGTNSMESFENIEKECLGRRTRLDEGEDSQELSLGGIPIKKIH